MYFQCDTTVFFKVMFWILQVRPTFVSVSRVILATQTSVSLEMPIPKLYIV